MFSNTKPLLGIAGTLALAAASSAADVGYAIQTAIGAISNTRTGNGIRIGTITTTTTITTDR
jgi:hypothetical protein